MVKVPEYQRTERLRPAYQQGIDVRASAADFGAAIGQGMQGLGAGLGQAADAVQKIQTFRNENDARDTDTKFSDWLRERSYGEGGYFKLEGKNAVDGREAFEKEVEAKRLEFGSKLKPGAANLYQRASQARTQSTFQQAIQHGAGEEKQYYRDTNDASRTSFAQDALANYQNPAAVQRSINAGLGLLADRGVMEGMGGVGSEWYKAEAAKYTSGIHSGIVSQMADVDVIAADKYLKENEAEFLPTDRQKIAKMLAGPLQEAKTVSLVDGWETEAGSPPAPTATPMGGTSDIVAQLVPHVIHTESRGNPNAVSPKGARGRMQVMPGTGTDPGYGIRPWDGTDADNVRVGTEYLRAMLNKYDGDVSKALAAYNWGPGNMDKAIAKHGGAWLAHAPTETKNYVRDILKNSGSGGTVSVAGVPTSSGDADAAWLANMYKKADAIRDPSQRDAAYAEIDKRYSRRNKVMNAAREETVETVQNRMLADPNFDPTTLPLSAQQAIGLSGMSTLKETYRRNQSGGVIDSDPLVMDRLLEEAEIDPAGFAKKDLTPYLDKLSHKDFFDLRGKQREARGDLAKAQRTGSVFQDAKRAASEFYGAAGIKSGNTKAAQHEDNQKLKAQYDGAVRNAVQAYIDKNGEAPSYEDMRKIAASLSIKATVSETRSSWSPARLFDDDQDDVWEGRAFQVGEAPRGNRTRFEPSYANIPPEMVEPIRATLSKQLGRKATNTEVAAEWGKQAAAIRGF